MTEKEQKNFSYLEQFHIYKYIKLTLFSLREKNMIKFNTSNAKHLGNEKNCLLELDEFLKKVHPKTISNKNDDEFRLHLVCEYAEYLITRIININLVYDYPNFKNVFLRELKEILNKELAVKRHDAALQAGYITE